MAEVLGFIGFGEVACCLLRGMNDCGYDVEAYGFDVNAPLARERSKQIRGIKICESLGELFNHATHIIVAVPGSADKKMFETLYNEAISNCIFMDLSTVLPSEKKEIAERVAICGASYIDVAVMGSVPKLLQRTPMLISGQNTDEMIKLLCPLGFDLTKCGIEVGVASTIKLCRSIFMKGLPALFFEAKRTCEKYNVSEQVFSSIYKNMADQDIDAFLNRLLDGAYKHTNRQTEELLECIEMEKAVGINPLMTIAAVDVFVSINEEKKNGQQYSGGHCESI